MARLQLSVAGFLNNPGMFRKARSTLLLSTVSKEEMIRMLLSVRYGSIPNEA
ncbi:hypothetical protein [Millionella massiliensis]|uniref:hypothetical protein n=1 Tax=Millionella massiliensis TaxID=1871023 RepID=UPI0023A8FB23|nr:hypothetical protein [Millionella massiliensis]